MIFSLRECPAISHALANNSISCPQTESRIMPTAVHAAKPLQMVRDPSYFGLKADKKNHHRPKPIPWVDVSEEEGKNKHKRKGSIHHDHSNNGQNGPKHKKPRHSLHRSDSNGAGPSQHNNSHVNGTKLNTPLNAKAKGIQEQRKHLPIAKGSLCRLKCMVFMTHCLFRKRCTHRRDTGQRCHYSSWRNRFWENNS